MAKLVTCCSILFVSLSTAAFAQSSWIPYTAHFVETSVDVNPSGVSTTATREGLEARSSDGSTVQQEIDTNTNKPFRERLYDSSEGIVYTIDFNQKNALGKFVKLDHWTKPRVEPLAHESIAGVTATAYPIKNPQTQKQDGVLWVVDGTDIMVRITINLPNGGSYRMERSDLHIGTDPAPSLFVMPVGMEVSKPMMQH